MEELLTMAVVQLLFFLLMALAKLLSKALLAVPWDRPGNF